MQFLYLRFVPFPIAHFPFHSPAIEFDEKTGSIIKFHMLTTHNAQHWK